MTKTYEIDPAKADAIWRQVSGETAREEIAALRTQNAMLRATRDAFSEMYNEAIARAEKAEAELARLREGMRVALARLERYEKAGTSADLAALLEVRE